MSDDCGRSIFIVARKKTKKKKKADRIDMNRKSRQIPYTANQMPTDNNLPAAVPSTGIIRNIIKKYKKRKFLYFLYINQSALTLTNHG